ncbi:MAG: hypothetical protein R2690_01130 [Acidimicrobiales bacterium]
MASPSAPGAVVVGGWPGAALRVGLASAPATDSETEASSSMAVPTAANCSVEPPPPRRLTTGCGDDDRRWRPRR